MSVTFKVIKPNLEDNFVNFIYCVGLLNRNLEFLSVVLIINIKLLIISVYVKFALCVVFWSSIVHMLYSFLSITPSNRLRKSFYNLIAPPCSQSIHYAIMIIINLFMYAAIDQMYIYHLLVRHDLLWLRFNNSC